MEQTKQKEQKRWYQKWWGIVILIFFFVIAMPIAIIQCKLSKKKKIMLWVCYAILMVIGILGQSGNESTNTINKNTANNVEKINTTTENKSKNEEKNKKEIEEKVEEEKKRIRAEFLSYEKEHLALWNKMTESIQQSDIYSSYEYANKSKKNIFEVWKKIQNLECNTTGDIEFDENCKKLIENGETAYLLKQTAVEKLMDWLENVNSPKKATEAKETLEHAAEGWQIFQLQLALTTLSKEELEKWQKETEQNKDSKK